MVILNHFALPLCCLKRQRILVKPHFKLALIDAEKQSSMVASHDVSLLDLGERLGYPELHIKHPSGGHDIVIRAGLLSWKHFSDVAEGRAIRAAMEAARATLSNRHAPSG